jgi:hypothetical protein
MTDTPEDLPSPDEFRRKMAHVDREFADARRYLLWPVAGDADDAVTIVAGVADMREALPV